MVLWIALGASRAPAIMLQPGDLVVVDNHWATSPGVLIDINPILAFKR